MKHISSWKIPPGTMNAAIKRFLETGGAPPEGIKMLGRWHGMNGQGFAIFEATDANALALRSVEPKDPIIPANQHQGLFSRHNDRGARCADVMGKMVRQSEQNYEVLYY